MHKECIIKDRSLIIWREEGLNNMRRGWEAGFSLPNKQLGGGGECKNCIVRVKGGTTVFEVFFKEGHMKV